MSRQASILAAIATLALSLGALASTSASTAYAAGTCNAAPKPAAPAGSRWYYRTDRTLGRKCWYLATEGQKFQTATPRTAATTDAEPVAPPMAEAAARLTEPLSSPPPAAAAPAASTIVSQAAPSAPLQGPPGDSVQRGDEPTSAASAQEPAATAAPEPMADQTPTAAPAASAAATATATRINAMQFVFVAFVGICFLAGLFFYLAAVRRRRTEVRIVDLNTTASLRMPAMAALTDSPSVASDATGRRDADEIDDERLRRFSQAWKRQAA
jgi:hypothetical protein